MAGRCLDCGLWGISAASPMSEPLRIAAVAEGRTDIVVLRAVLDCILANSEFEFHSLQPEGSAAFGLASTGRTGAGWGGVYRWARQSVAEGNGSVVGSSALFHHDLLIVQVDADVAGNRYSSASIHDPPSHDLPCVRPCPPPDGTTNALRRVILRWLGERQCPSQIVLCTPSKSIEAWVIAAVWPNNPVILRGNWECHPNPQDQLRALPHARRFRKHASDYRAKQHEMTMAWPQVSTHYTEAARFESEFRAALPPIGADGSFDTESPQQDP